MHFIPPQPGSFEEMCKYLDAGASDAHGGWGQKERKAWIHERLFTCHYEHLGRAEKGQVRQFLQKITGYSRAQIAREIAVYRLEKSARGQQEVPAAGNELQADSKPQASSGELQADSKPQASSGEPQAELAACPPGRMSVRTGSLQLAARRRPLWSLIRRCLLISSLVTNIAFVAMLLGMSLLERAEKAQEKNSIQARSPIMETMEEQPIHAAPSYAPMP